MATGKIQQTMEIAQRYRRAGRLPDVVAFLHQAVASQPASWELRVALADALGASGDLAGAEAAYRNAIQLQPHLFEAHVDLGRLLYLQGRPREAVEFWQKALALKPGHLDVLRDLAEAYQALDRLGEAVACRQQALHANDQDFDTWHGLGIVLSRRGQTEQALAAYRRSLQLAPDELAARSNLLFLLAHQMEDPEALFAEHVQFARRCQQGLEQIAPHRNVPDPHRRLKIAYLSADLHEHAVTHFLEPILTGHDRNHFEVFCYSDRRKSDNVTQRLRGHVDGWRDVATLAQDRLADLIRADAVDILVELGVHTNGGRRMRLLARKPAPVQVTHLGYPGTTGLSTVDWKITDPHIDPPGLSEKHHSERLLRLPQTQWCYLPSAVSPEVGPLPALQSGSVTFGCSAKVAKITPAQAQLWGGILQEVPGSRLAVKSLSLQDPSTRQWLGELLAGQGVALHRVEFSDPTPLAEYLAWHQGVDLLLDTFPFNGGTTSCHALWMGVPVVSRSGQTSVSRVGASLLRNLGMDELLTQTPEEYVRLAVTLAGNLQRLAELRGGLRERMSRSPLCDAPQFVRHLEEAYRRIWVQWCDSSAATAEVGQRHDAGRSSGSFVVQTEPGVDRHGH